MPKQGHRAPPTHTSRYTHTHLDVPHAALTAGIEGFTSMAAVGLGFVVTDESAIKLKTSHNSVATTWTNPFHRAVQLRQKGAS
jgi:hypothetical protein